MRGAAGFTKKRRTLALLLAALVLLAAALWAASTRGVAVRSPYYEEQLDAARRMQRCMDAVKDYKSALGIPLDAEDYHQTGMLGEEFNFMTTTLGAPEAKRTSANNDMAALAVRLLHEAGVKPGDTVGASFSGSFPALNLAVLCASAAMRISVVYCSSVGSSTHGANNPGLTFPEIAHRLYEDGLLPQDSALVTLGGGDDVGGGMDEALRAAAQTRLEALCLPLMREPDYLVNISRRIALFEEQGPIACFVSAGGNVTSLGRREDSAYLGQGLLKDVSPPSIDEQSGLIQRYQAMGLPVIHLLNVKKLVADYGLPYDPAALPEPGTSAVYYSIEYPKMLIVPALAAVSALLWLCWKRRR